jgi:hypothetical protein
MMPISGKPEIGARLLRMRGKRLSKVQTKTLTLRSPP